jgi:hypothetical protein
MIAQNFLKNQFLPGNFEPAEPLDDRDSIDFRSGKPRPKIHGSSLFNFIPSYQPVLSEIMRQP